MWFLFLVQFAFAQESKPPFDVSQLKALHLCLDDIATICYSLQRDAKKANAALEIRNQGRGYNEKKITGTEFETRAADVFSKVEFPIRSAGDCSPRLKLSLHVGEEVYPGFVCVSKSEGDWDKWLPYFR